MFRPEFRTRLWAAAAAAVWLVLVHAATALVLLRADNANIAFTESEINGLSSYTGVIGRYFALLQEQATPENALAATHMRDLIQRIGSSSNLILDPVLESYYDVDLLFNHIPWLALAARNGTDINQAQEIERLNFVSTVLARSTVHQDVLGQIARIKNDLEQKNLGKILDDDLTSLTSSITQSLRQMLDQRLLDQKNHRLLLVVLITLIASATYIILIIAMRNYVSRKELVHLRAQQALSQKLAQKNEELELFTFAVAHDLKEPLRTMACFAKLLREEGSDVPASSNEYTQIIENTAHRAEKMIATLIDYTQIIENKWPLERCDCKAEILAAQEDLKNIIKQKRPEITVGVMPVLQSVPILFRRIMLNLIDNALKYHKEGQAPQIEISAEQQEDCWHFSVTDKGEGIDEKHLSDAFAPFKRLPRKKQQDGHGIGLTSCKKMVEILDGKIWIDSQLGVYTTVHFTLPIS